MHCSGYDQLRQIQDFFIFGAQATAYGIYCAVKEIFGKAPKYFIVSQIGGNPDYIENIQVVSLENAKPYNGFLVLVATPSQYHIEITRLLNEKGFNNICVVDSKLEYQLMGDFFARTQQLLLLENTPLSKCISSKTEIYMVRNDADRPLSLTYVLPHHIIPIHAGRALSDVTLADIGDNTGSNISEKNRNYCELTATYWVWKNVSSVYKGICHYRRIFKLNDMLLKKLSNVDALLPLPFWCYPDASAQYRRYVSERDFSLMMEAIGKVAPEYLSQAKLLFSGKLLYNYNMIVAKQSVFDSYCGFLFGALAEIEACCEDKNRSDRYIGYLGELLTSLFFVSNNKKIKIAHAQREWLV